jgi:hypothetical protein
MLYSYMLAEKSHVHSENLHGDDSFFLCVWIIICMRADPLCMQSKLVDAATN